MAKMRSHSQTLDAVKAFVDRWTGRGYEKGESQQFWTDLLHDVLDIETPSEIISFESQVKLASTSFMDGYIAPTKVLIEQKSIDKDLRKGIKQSDGSLLNPFQQAKRYAAELPVSKHPRWVVTCNFKSFLIYDMENPHGEPEEVLLENLEKDYYRLRFLVEDGKAHLKRELEVSIKAGELVGKLYDAFLKQYGGDVTPRDLHSLNVLCVRLVFCLYAEDAGIFSKDQFYYYMAQYKPSQMNVALRELFATLDTKYEDRSRFLPQNLKDFPYVNGSLFQQHPGEDIPQFDKAMSELLLKEASLGFDWSEISPTIFGAVFESTLNPETRRSGGMHYTSIENIHKVIDPLFMNELRAEFEKIKEEKHDHKRRQKLETFQNKLASLTFLDPACGSGNFLTETYISLRRLENEAISLRLKGQKLLGLEQLNPIKVNIHQFYGIEINDFAVTVATTALWIAESQMMHETERIIKFDLDYLPLKSFTNIHLGNALRMDWNDLTRPQSGHPLHSGEGDGFAVAHPDDLTRPQSGHPLHSGEGDGFAVAHPDNTYYKDGTNREFVTYGNRIDNEKLILAKQYRKAPTSKEAEVWEWLRNKKMLGLKWRRQQVINGYIADFYCTEILTVLEIDGEVHDTPEAVAYDEIRTDVFAKRGIRTIRIKNNECTYNNVKKLIESVLSNPPLQNGEGVPAERTGARSFDYIMGNPPFVGKSYQTKEQKEDMAIVFNGVKNYGNLDYVASWYKKCGEYIRNTTTVCSFVSTNSVCQGIAVPPLWNWMFSNNIVIDFAYPTFKWNSEAKDKAAVHCVIIGFSDVHNNRQKLLFTNNTAFSVSNINAYLLNAPNIIVENRSQPICNVPNMYVGSCPTDGGGFIIEETELLDLINIEPNSKKYIHPYIGSEEFLHKKKRYCLWLKTIQPTELKQLPKILERVRLVKEFRESSKKEQTRRRANTPTLFAEDRYIETRSLVMPQVSSENRKYIPSDFVDSEVIPSNLLYFVPNAELYHFGVLSSNVHMAWMRVVAGRLESRYRYNAEIVYNNFPWPDLTPNPLSPDGDIPLSPLHCGEGRGGRLAQASRGREVRSKIERTAQAILDARALYPDSSLADLYDEVTMPPELRRAHQNNDRAVMEAYGFDWRNMTESECVAELFKLYSKLVDEEKATVAPARRKRSTRSRVAPSGGESGG